MITDTYTVFWREMVLLRKKFKSFFAGSMVSPLLYLLSFGWGLGRNIQFGTTSYLDFVVPGIIALSAMNASYNATGASLNVSLATVLPRRDT
jgi:ABC-2 type transport system permease protein